MTYNYRAFEAGHYDLANFLGPKPGTRAPDFEVVDLAGNTRRLLDFDGPFLVLEMGSRTCPLYQGRRPAMEQLKVAHPDVAFRVLYVREAHPGANIGAHGTMENKIACATGLVAEDGESREVLVDDLGGAVHAAYGGYPNSVFIINRPGCVVYASDWNDPRATSRALSVLKAGDSARVVRAFFKPVPPSVSLRVLGRGGKGSLADFLRSFPRLVWHNLIMRNIRLMLGRPAVVDPDTSC